MITEAQWTVSILALAYVQELRVSLRLNVCHFITTISRNRLNQNIKVMWGI